MARFRLRVEQPCRVDWDGMDGDGVVRFCRRCEKNVHDLSAMGEVAARRFLAEGGSPCVRYQVDGDGRMLFVARARQLLPRVAAAAALTLGVAAGGGCMMGKPRSVGSGCPVQQPAAAAAEEAPDEAATQAPDSPPPEASPPRG